MGEEKKKKPIEVFESELPEGLAAEDEDHVRVFKLSEPDQQFFVATESEIPGHIVFVNFSLGIGFAIPLEYAHQFTHMVHESLETLLGPDIDKPIEEKKPTYP